MAARELQGVKRSVDGQKELCAQFEAHILNLNNRIAEEQLLHSQTKSALEDHREKVNIHEDQVVGLKGEIEKYKDSLHQANQNLEEAKRTFSGENQKVNRLSRAAEEFKKNAEHYKSQLDALKLSLIAKDEELASLQQSQDVLYGSLNKEVSRLFAEKQSLVARQEELEDIIDTLLTALDEEKERSEQMAAQFRKMDQNASAMEREYFLFQDDIHAKLESMDSFNTSQQELNLSLIDQINQLISQNQQILNEKEALQKSLMQIERQRSQTMETLARRDLEIEQLTASHKPFNRNLERIYEPERSRIHVVMEGDSLSQISMRYYGIPHRWVDIYEANDDIISDVNQLLVGNILIIPE